MLGFKDHYEMNEWLLMGAGDILLLHTDGLTDHRAATRSLLPDPPRARAAAGGASAGPRDLRRDQGGPARLRPPHRRRQPRRHQKGVGSWYRRPSWRGTVALIRADRHRGDTGRAPRRAALAAQESKTPVRFGAGVAGRVRQGPGLHGRRGPRARTAAGRGGDRPAVSAERTKGLAQRHPAGTKASSSR